MDDQTQSTLDEILNASSSQCNIDSLVKAAKSEDVTLPPEQDKIIREANAIYERLLREAAEDEAKKQAEIDAVKQSMASNSKTTSNIESSPIRLLFFIIHNDCEVLPIFINFCLE